MPLRIRCPHCASVLVAADEEAGEPRPCPNCGQMFSVPLPRAAADLGPVPTVKPAACPRCGAEVAPTASFCHACHTDLQTGRRLPLKQRLRLLSWRVWLFGSFTLACVLVIAVAVVQVYRIRSQPARTVYRPVTPKSVPLARLAHGLLSAQTDEQRRAALDELRGVEERAAPAVGAALAASLDQAAAGEQLRRNRLAAIDLIARHGTAHAAVVPSWLATLERCQQEPGLRAAALRARGLLGDVSVLEELAVLWLDCLRRTLFFKDLLRAAQVEPDAAAALILRRAEASVEQAAEGLRSLARQEDHPVFERLVEAYWESWSWLGQGQGDRLANEIFALARPAKPTLEFRPEDVRGPRDIMKRTAERASPGGRAAAGLVLEHCGPQYRTACRAIAEALARLLPECEPADQQRLTWAISRLHGKLFGSVPRSHPLDVTPEEVRAAIQWGQPGQTFKDHPSYPSPPVLVYRATTAERLLEADLLKEIRRGWPSARVALDTWQAAGLGCTARIRACLHPGRRRPDYTMLAAAMVIVAECREPAMRRELELWHEAAEQPAWVRALAYTVLGSLDARRGSWDSGWPAGLDLGETAVLEAECGWEPFGRVLAAGGPAAIERLTTFQPVSLPAAVAAKLLQAAEEAAGRYPSAGRARRDSNPAPPASRQQE